MTIANNGWEVFGNDRMMELACGGWAVYYGYEAGGYAVAEEMQYRITDYGMVVTREEAGFVPAVPLPMVRVGVQWVVDDTLKAYGYAQAERLPYMTDDGYLRVFDVSEGFFPAQEIPYVRVRGSLVVICDNKQNGFATAEVLGEFFDDEYVYNYSTNVLEVFEIDPPGDDLVYGLELETAPLPDVVRAQVNRGGFIWKTDSSCGMELVSAPMGINSLCAVVENMPLELLSVNRSCGMHVHINRRALTQRQACLLALLISDEESSDEIDKVAGRAANDMCKKTKAKDTFEVSCTTDRHEAVNLTNYGEDKYTVEVRIFAGSDSCEVVCRRLRWLHSLVLFVKSDKASAKYKDFKRWIVTDLWNQQQRFRYKL